MRRLFAESRTSTLRTACVPTSRPLHGVLKPAFPSWISRFVLGPPYTRSDADSPQFLEVCMNIDPQEKMITKERIEKYILRKAFDTTDEPETKPYLPEKILWRQKEQFSDGVGYGWIDALKDNAELHVSDEDMKNPK